jgi:hypothetical protein
MVPAFFDVEELICVSSMPCTAIKFNAKIGLRLLTRTLLAAPEHLLDVLGLWAIRRGPDNLPTTIIDETFDLGFKGFRLEGPFHLDIFLEPITECGSRTLLAHVFGERRLLFAPWIRTEVNLLRNLVASYLQRACLVRADCIGSLVGG